MSTSHILEHVKFLQTSGPVYEESSLLGTLFPPTHHPAVSSLSTLQVSDGLSTLTLWDCPASKDKAVHSMPLL